MLTINDLKSFARSKVRRSFSDYGDIQAWNHDTYQIRKQRESCNKFARFIIGKEILYPGVYGRLIIGENTIEYVTGQYAPMEIYNAILNYLEETNY